MVYVPFELEPDGRRLQKTKTDSVDDYEGLRKTISRHDDNYDLLVNLQNSVTLYSVSKHKNLFYSIMSLISDC